MRLSAAGNLRARGKVTDGHHQRVAPSWHLVSGEYPPSVGGVADYTRHLAQALATHGEVVHVWAPGRTPLHYEGDVSIHGLPGFGRRGLSLLSAGLAQVPGKKRLLIEYVAQAFGFRGMNVPFALWVSKRQAEEVWVHFHEVAHGFSRTQQLKLNLLSSIQRRMAQTLARRANRTFISIPGWRQELFAYGAQAEVLPIPSNVPTDVPRCAIEHLREARGLAPVVAHFGTYGEAVTRALGPTLVLLLRRIPLARALLLGRGAGTFAASLASRHPDIREKLETPAEMSGDGIAIHLASSDVALQPFPDGISGRRTSAMAGLALGVPIVTTHGPLTEPEWFTSGAVVLARVDSPEDLATAVIDLLASETARNELGTRGRNFYQSCFSMERSLAVLRLHNRLSPLDTE